MSRCFYSKHWSKNLQIYHSAKHLLKNVSLNWYRCADQIPKGEATAQTPPKQRRT